MKLRWEEYFYELGSAILKSIGAQGFSWSGVNGLNAAGLDVPNLNLKTLGWMLLIGAVAPAVFKFWEKTPLPERMKVEEQTITEREGDKSKTVTHTTITKNPAEESSETTHSEPTPPNETPKGYRRD